MWRRTLLGVASASACLALAACGSSNSGNSTTTAMTGAQYTQFLRALSQQENQAHHALDQALHGKSVSQIQQGLQAFVSDQANAADRVSGVTPPANAKAANDQLRTAFSDIGASINPVLSQIQTASSPQQAIHMIQQAKGPQQSGQELDAALAQLKKLGYTQGS